VDNVNSVSGGKCKKVKYSISFFFGSTDSPGSWNQLTIKLICPIRENLKGLKWYYDQIFTPWFFRYSIPWENKNVVSHLQISALVPHLVETYCKESNISDTNWPRYLSSFNQSKFGWVYVMSLFG